jgi:hypothetical protein
MRRNIRTVVVKQKVVYLRADVPVLTKTTRDLSMAMPVLAIKFRGPLETFRNIKFILH